MDDRQEIPLTRVERVAVQALVKEQQRVNREIQEVTGDIAARLGLPPHAFFTSHELDTEAGVVRPRPLPPAPEPPPSAPEPAVMVAEQIAAGVNGATSGE